MISQTGDWQTKCFLENLQKQKKWRTPQTTWTFKDFGMNKMKRSINTGPIGTPDCPNIPLKNVWNMHSGIHVKKWDWIDMINQWLRESNNIHWISKSGISSYDRFRVQFHSKQWLGLQNEIRAGHKRARVTEGEEVTIWTLWLTWNLGDQMEQVDTHTHTTWSQMRLCRLVKSYGHCRAKTDLGPG